MRWIERICLPTALAASLCVLIQTDVRAQTEPGRIPVLELPAFALKEAEVVSLAQKAPDQAIAALDLLIETYPAEPQLWVVRALLTGALGDRTAAVEALLTAERLGAPGLRRLIEKPELAGVAYDPRLSGLTDRAAPIPKRAVPALVQNGKATVTENNSAWNRALSRIVSRFTFPPILRTHAYADGRHEGPIGELQTLIARGFAAGNAGDLYDNRDDGHSRLRPGKRIQLTHVAYDEAARAAGIHYGLNTQILFDAPTFGNSSTALEGDLWRSQVRLALTDPGGAQRLWQLYANNHLYVFPEHRDHDPQSSGGLGDVFPANTPYALISQGSSGSDLLLIRPVQVIFAAFPPQVKARLIEANLIAPMVQQVFRRALAGGDDAAYMSARAHPTVFRAEDLDLGRMISLAQELKIDEIPPVVQISMRREPAPHSSIFADGLNETLFDTPGAIARLWRAAPYRRQYEIAAQAKDPNGRDLTFHWRVLRGDEERIRVTTLDDIGSRVRITVPWHDPVPVPGLDGMTSPRVDIAVFADNGAQISAPAFFSVHFPAHQARTYDPTGRLLSIDHRGHPKRYADPALWPSRDWQDTFLHDAQGKIIGWTRRREIEGGRAPLVAQFSAHGHRIIDRDAQGRPGLVQQVTYPRTPTGRGGAVVTEATQNTFFRYQYADRADRIGRPLSTPAP